MTDKTLPKAIPPASFGARKGLTRENALPWITTPLLLVILLFHLLQLLLEYLHLNNKKLLLQFLLEKKF